MTTIMTECYFIHEAKGWKALLDNRHTIRDTQNLCKITYNIKYTIDFIFHSVSWLQPICFA